jgi:endonuclease/exonuclease/phosphatase family metal-dependent hydrolase
VKICTFNVENLFLSPLGTALDRLEKLAAVLKDIDADIYALMEVHSEEGLKDFVMFYLNDSYHVSLIEGNSERGIHLAYMVKKSLPFRLEHLTHRRRPIQLLPNKKARYLSRDIAELRLYKQSDEHNPALILLAVHLKSKRSDTSADFGGKKTRGLEFRLLLDTYLHLNKRFKGQTPIIILGDFNGVLQPQRVEPEFSDITLQTELKDVLELLNYAPQERITQISFNHLRETLAEQFDYLFLPAELWPFVDTVQSGVYRFKNDKGIPLALAQTPEQRSRLPSDHYPVVVKLTKNL